MPKLDEHDLIADLGIEFPWKTEKCHEKDVNRSSSPAVESNQRVLRMRKGMGHFDIVVRFGLY
jgi:hypothetical protein